MNEDCGKECTSYVVKVQTSKDVDKDVQESEKSLEDISMSEDGLSRDWFGKHNIFTRAMVIVITGVYIYAFCAPLSEGLATLATYSLILALLIITFGINSLKILGVMIDKWKK